MRRFLIGQIYADVKKCDRFREKISGKQGWPGKSSETTQVIAGWRGTGKNKRTEGRKGLAHENNLRLILILINTPHFNSMGIHLCLVVNKYRRMRGVFCSCTSPTVAFNVSSRPEPDKKSAINCWTLWDSAANFAPNSCLVFFRKKKDAGRGSHRVEYGGGAKLGGPYWGGQSKERDGERKKNSIIKEMTKKKPFCDFFYTVSSMNRRRKEGKGRYSLNNFVRFQLVIPIRIDYVENVFSNLDRHGVGAQVLLHFCLEFFFSNESIVVGIKPLIVFLSYFAFFLHHTNAHTTFWCAKYCVRHPSADFVEFSHNFSHCFIIYSGFNWLHKILLKNQQSDWPMKNIVGT